MLRKLRFVVCMALLMGAVWAADTSGRKIIHREEPDYPQLAAQMNLHGMVKLRIWISADGSVRRLEYIGGHPLLAQSALKAVKAWRYELSPKETTAQVEIKF